MRKDEEQLEGRFGFVPGTGGWCSYWSPELAGHKVWLRLSDENGYLAVADIHVESPRSLHAEVLRHIPTRKVEQWVNGGNGSPRLIKEIAKWRERPPLESLLAWRSLSGFPPVSDPMAVPGSTGDLSLDVPGQGRRYSKEFYMRVAIAWRVATTMSGSPSALIADTNNVAKRTVDGWLRETRRQGLIPPARPRSHPQTVLHDEQQEMPPKGRA